MNTSAHAYYSPRYWLHSTVNSYAVVFFSSNRWFGLLLLLASLMNPVSGLCGLAGVCLANVFATAIGLNRDYTMKGYYGYDAMLVCCALATFYVLSPTMILVMGCVVLLSVMLSLAVNGFMQKYQLPSLSFPFLFTIWIILAAIPSIPALQVHTEILFSPKAPEGNGFSLPHYIETVENLMLPALVKVYFKSLSSLFFQASILSGTIIALGLLLYSRIAFTLSILGYVSAYAVYQLFGGNVEDFYINFVGLNFIFQAIAIGGIYLVPSFVSYLMVVILTPVLILMVFACNKLLYAMGLQAYSLPFTLVTILFLYLLSFRVHVRRLHTVSYQTLSPEQNLYNFLNSNQRLRLFNYFPVHLPFWGEWVVSQGHDGKITHLGNWSKAFDFIVLDGDMKSYREPGASLEDFYCYDKPVVACADGYVATVEDNIDDNRLKDVNTIQNWGNSVVIWHVEGLYSQVSHLKKDSIKVKAGDYVHKGDVIGLCGNSGRSPEPHIHFQLQASPAVGTPTLDYPLAYYLVKEKGKWDLKTFEKPREGQTICSVQTNPLLKSAFNLIPGMKLRFRVSDSGAVQEDASWEVFTDSYNYSYIYCHTSKAVAYFYNDGSLFYFTSYTGSKDSLLYYFYLAHYKVLLGYYQDLHIREMYPIATIRRSPLSFVQDFITPFYRMVRTGYTMRYDAIDDISLPSEIRLSSDADIYVMGLKREACSFHTLLKDGGISEFTIIENQKKRIAVCVPA